mgnify:FL=1|jgi:hypothetical protein
MSVRSGPPPDASGSGLFDGYSVGRKWSTKMYHIDSEFVKKNFTSVPPDGQPFRGVRP